MPKTTLIIAAHTDDEALGCGGTIALLVAGGDDVHAVFMADGVNSRPTAHSHDHEQRMEAARQAQKILGIETIHYLDFPDNRMDGLPLLDVVQPLERIIHECSPDVIYTHHCGDLNIDHRIAHQAVLTACRPQPGFCVKEIYGFEVLSSTDWAFARQDAFVPTVFVDISAYLPTKLKALQAYQSEMRPAPHTRSIQHAELLARHRGYTVGVDAAEAFEAIRIIK
ncbi:PIG-L deacetylase family protein [Desulfobulbus alkaliphilus]|uniref:PIG-L deacetylase family protein n=1 Tax=Desulfobulbus alkaliphilus TaxID=869814 RepID=UPI00196659B3|nr:PIG-L deacetylase family protein [Desulfobulbus alkaliphilus]MBM9538347.1 PIG-L family deacetylase [Desulfobulbus alkaliphilus]